MIGPSSERGELETRRQPCRGRREAIPSLKGLADGGPRVARVVELHDPVRWRLIEDDRQHAVVGRDEEMVAAFSGDAAANRADAGIDDYQEDCALREIAVRRRQLECAGEHVMRRDVMGNVNERRVGTHTEHHALHRADVMIADTEICEQSDQGPVRHLLSLTEPKPATQGCVVGFLKRISRVLFFNRNESDTRRPEKSRMMSRFNRIACRPRAAEYWRCLSATSSTMTYFV